MSTSREPVRRSVERFAAPPDPGQAGTLDDLVERLRLLKVWAGHLSYERITDRINKVWSAAGRPSGDLATKTTVVRCFQPGRRRLNPDLVVAVVQALHPDVEYVAQWHQALRVIGGRIEAASQVRVQDRLPPCLTAFVGRANELEHLRRGFDHVRQDGDTVAIYAIAGMAGLGKTQLAVNAGHLFVREMPNARVLFVNLRGFHPDPAQPPADPSAVLDGFLRLLGLPGQQIPHDLATRTAVYRDRLAGTRTLVVLDNAADEEQVRPLLPRTPGCVTLITSRRNLTGLPSATHLTPDVFAPDESVALLTGAVPEVLAGPDSHAAARIAQRCGNLPLALGLVAGHIRSTPAWTLTDHADRLDERHRQRRLDTGVELSFHLSYHHLPSDQRRCLRMLALHPGQDLDTHAAAALIDADLSRTETMLEHLSRDHLLQQVASGRYSFHDLVRAYASSCAVDEDPPSQRRTALTRLFDFYLAAAATAMDVAYTHQRQRLPKVLPVGTPTADPADPDQAKLWLDTELANLLAAAQHTAEHGWAGHTRQLATILDWHLRTCGHFHEGEMLQQRALDAALHLGDDQAEMTALNSLGYLHRIQGRAEQAGDHHERALRIAQTIGDRVGELTALLGLARVHRVLSRHAQARDHYERALHIAQTVGDHVGELQALTGLARIHWLLGSRLQARDHYERALHIAQTIGDRSGELQALSGLGDVHRLLGGHARAGDHYEQALHIAQTIGHRSGELQALIGLGLVHRLLGHHARAGDHYEQALHIAQAIGHRFGELCTLNGLGDVHRALGRHSEAADRYQQVFDLASEVGSSNFQFEALQGLGRLHHAAGQPDLALVHHEKALHWAVDLAQPDDQARAHDGLAHAHHALNDHDQARRHWQHALDILTGLDTDHTEDIEASVPHIQAHLAKLNRQQPTAT